MRPISRPSGGGGDGGLSGAPSLLSPAYASGAGSSPVSPLTVPMPSGISGSEPEVSLAAAHALPLSPRGPYSAADLLAVSTYLASIGMLYSVSKESSSLANGAEESLDYGADLKGLQDSRGPQNERWRIFALYGAHSGSGTGPWRIDRLRSGGYDMGHDLYVKSAYLPVGGIFPSVWDGACTVRVTNRSGATSVLGLTLYVGPVAP